MANITLTELFTDIADALRERLGISDKIVADDFPSMCQQLISNELFMSILNKTVITVPESYLFAATAIRPYAFYDCDSLTSISIPDSVTSIGNYAFDGCSSLRSITIPNSVTSIDEAAFRGCHNLTTINVPWAEGAVSGAPWGAINATINYNYKEV